MSRWLDAIVRHEDPVLWALVAAVVAAGVLGWLARARPREPPRDA